MLTSHQETPESFEHGNSSFTRIPTIDDFEFIKPISRGAFGKVFLGHKKGKPDQLYAIKAMKKVDMINKNLKDQVVTERDAMARSASPFIVQLYYSIQSQQNIFLVMEYLIGGDVKSLLSVAGFFDEHMAFMYTAEVTLALEYLHGKGIVHRDLKPDNMLITKTGHIKLTDFGLSKFNMNFNEVPMTPKTPMPYSQIVCDDHRTPGQILSLRSTFAFSVKKELPNHSYATTPSHWSSYSRNPLSDLSDNKTPITPHSKLIKTKSLREAVLSQSATKKLPPVIPETPESVLSTPPIKRLMSTLQDSVNWTKSSASDLEHSASAKPSVRSSLQSGPIVQQKPMGLSFSGMDNGGYSSGSIELSSDMYVDSSEISDSVFEQSSIAECSKVSDAGHLSVDRTKDSLKASCSCKTDETNQINCSECRSHNKAPSRQETMTDETPQMHRTDESVWNSYAAKNLRSLREGEYSGDSEDNAATDKENIRQKEKPLVKDFKTKCAGKNIKPRKLVKAKSFSYPSDDEQDFDSIRRYKAHKRFSRKRSFQDVAQSPKRRAQSAETGLTQELRLFHLEPCSKRSNSFPRTRIRFHSGSSDTELTDKKSSSQSKIDTLPKEDLKKIVENFPSVAESERLSKLSIEENRQCDNMSVVIDSSQLSLKKIVNSESSVCDSVTSHIKHEKDKSIQGHVQDSLEESRFDLFCDRKRQEERPVDFTDACAVLHDRVAALKTNMVSSLKSEGDLKMMINSEFSSIHDTDSDFPSCLTYDMDTSVFTSAYDSSWDKKPGFSSTDISSDAKSKDLFPVSNPPTPLLPPPPPKKRHTSGKKPPARVKCNSEAAWYSHNDSRRSSCGGPNIPSTPEHTGKPKVMFHTPNLRYSRTPRTPYEKVMMRSQSFTAAKKTPFRTPKSVRRAPLPSEDERILGTPDYLAPEILQQKPHGKEVDWWALGVCLFEFLTGVPPFNDQTPDLVFENILRRDIPWPEGEEALSQEAQDAIDALLTVEISARPGARAVRKMAAFKDINWHKLLDMEAPFIPQPEDITDTSYFEARNQLHDLFVSEVDL